MFGYDFLFLKEKLQSCSDFLVLPEATPKSKPSWFGFPITLRENSPVKRNDLVKMLNQNQIGTRLLFAGNLIHQPYMEKLNYRVVGDLMNSNTIMNNTFWVGVYPGLTERMLEFTADKIRTILSCGS